MKAESSKPGLIIIGIDGGTFDLIKPMIKAGKLPNLRSLIIDGVHGNLESTIPPITAPAWVTFATGKNPGKHGVYDFVWQSNDKCDRPLVNASSIRSKTVWQILSDRSFRVGLINVPITYPPVPINGYIIAGLLSPSEESVFTYPPGLRAELIGQTGAYPLEVQIISSISRGEVAYIKALFKGAKKRMDAARYLLREKPVDVFIMVFTILDRLQHRYWRCMESGDAGKVDSWKARFKGVIQQGYEKIDNYIGEILETYGQNADVLILSDHGFGPLLRNFYIHRWLTDLGFMSLLYARAQPGKSFSEHVDWSKTTAYSCFASAEESIFINLKGRESHGIVRPGIAYERIRERIIRALKELRDPLDGRPVVDRVMKREEIYHGPMLDKAPDIQFITRNLEYSLNGNPYAPSWVTGRPIARQESGYHRLEGILIMKGHHIRKGGMLLKSRLMDVAPTVLYMLGERIPGDMDGQVLDVFTEEYVASHPVIFEKADREPEGKTEEEVSPGVFTDEDRQFIKKALRDLGYKV